MESSKLFPVVLNGISISLHPINLSKDMPDLYKVSNGSPITTKTHSIASYDPREVLWKYTPCDTYESEDEMRDNYNDAINEREFLIFTLFDNQTSIPIGTLGYGLICPKKLKVEIVMVWVSPIAQGTGKCSEAAYLMIEHAFSIGYKFVHWACTTDNLRSRRIPEKLGFKIVEFTGDYLIKQSKSFDLIVFEICEFEWKTRKNGPGWLGI